MAVIGKHTSAKDRFCRRSHLDFMKICFIATSVGCLYSHPNFYLELPKTINFFILKREACQTTCFKFAECYECWQNLRARDKINLIAADVSTKKEFPLSILKEKYLF